MFTFSSESLGPSDLLDAYSVAHSSAHPFYPVSAASIGGGFKQTALLLTSSTRLVLKTISIKLVEFRCHSSRAMEATAMAFLTSGLLNFPAPQFPGGSRVAS
jgi:hypothetical protein